MADNMDPGEDVEVERERERQRQPCHPSVGEDLLSPV